MLEKLLAIAVFGMVFGATASAGDGCPCPNSRLYTLGWFGPGGVTDPVVWTDPTACSCAEMKIAIRDIEWESAPGRSPASLIQHHVIMDVEVQSCQPNGTCVTQKYFLTTKHFFQNVGCQ